MAGMVCFVTGKAQTVGIGTPTPDSNAVLDIYSTNKGLLIPRILDTAMVAKPMEGLIIYNKNTRTPYYFDGRQWLSLGGRLPSGMNTSTDKITMDCFHWSPNIWIRPLPDTPLMISTNGGAKK